MRQKRLVESWWTAIRTHATLEERQGRFAVLAPDASEMAARTWRFGYENESAKLHLAMLLEWDRQEPGAGRSALMNLDRHG